MNQYIYNYTDHLGNVRLSYSDTNKDCIIQPRQYQTLICNNSPAGNLCYQGWKPGEIVETNNYYPFGLMHNYTATTQNAYQYKYNGKELQETGMYDYGARFYMPEIGRWGVVDAMAEAARRWGPYTYAYNNPIRFIDPDGNFSVSFSGEAAQQAFTAFKASMSTSAEHVEPGSQAEWNALKKDIQIKHASLFAMNLFARGIFLDELGSLSKSLNNMSILESSNQMYSLHKVRGMKGETIYKKQTDAIQINYVNGSNFVHEMTHGHQFEIGEMAFNIETGKTFGMDIDDEVEAYKAQAAFDSSSVGAPMNKIDKNFVTNLKDSNGQKVYGVGQTLSNTSPIKITINSTISEIILAYPQLKESLQSLDQNLKLKDFEGLKYKN